MTHPIVAWWWLCEQIRCVDIGNEVCLPSPSWWLSYESLTMDVQDHAEDVILNAYFGDESLYYQDLKELSATPGKFEVVSVTPACVNKVHLARDKEHILRLLNVYDAGVWRDKFEQALAGFLWIEGHWKPDQLISKDPTRRETTLEEYMLVNYADSLCPDLAGGTACEVYQLPPVKNILNPKNKELIEWNKHSGANATGYGYILAINIVDTLLGIRSTSIVNTSIVNLYVSALCHIIAGTDTPEYTPRDLFNWM